MLPKYKYLLTYRYTEMIYDLTVEFCKTYLINFSNPSRRTIDQMIQTARSGKQNIIEGVGQSNTSKKGEIKLLGVANSFLEELIADYEDFLRQRKLVIWPKTDSKITQFRQLAYRLTNLNNLSPLGYLKEKTSLPKDQEAAANFLLTFCHQATYLLTKQIRVQEDKFIANGGYTENLFKRRLASKIG